MERGDVDTVSHTILEALEFELQNTSLNIITGESNLLHQLVNKRQKLRYILTVYSFLELSSF